MSRLVLSCLVLSVIKVFASQIGTGSFGYIVWKSWSLDILRFTYGTMQNGYKIVVFGKILSHDYEVQYNYGTSQVLSHLGKSVLSPNRYMVIWVHRLEELKSRCIKIYIWHNAKWVQKSSFWRSSVPWLSGTVQLRYITSLVH